MVWKWFDRLRGIEGRVQESDGATYLLTKDKIVEEGARLPYSVSRQEARRAFVAIKDGRPFSLWYNSGKTVISSRVTLNLDGCLKIDCQWFDKPETDKIMAWAFKE